MAVPQGPIGTEGRMKQTSVALSEFDRQELAYLQERLAESKGEVIRKAIRAYGALLKK
jgi:hypothetical protein